MSKREVPVVLITGYLGSGKTTLMQHLLTQEDRKIALIVNDMGSVNIDASILGKTKNQVEQIEMIEMQNGCICCTLKDEFMEEIERLAADDSIEAIFVEASGISEPSSIAGAFVNYEEETDTRVFLKTVVSVVDVDRMYKEFLNELSDDEDTEEGDIINLIIDQIEFCNVLLLNKTDLLTDTELKEVKDELRGLQREAMMIPCINGQVDLDVLLNSEDFDYDKVLSSSSVQRALDEGISDDDKACVDEYGITSFVYEKKEPFNREAFEKLVDEYPRSIIRTKGYIWFSDDVDRIQLFEQAGRNASITEMTKWVSAWDKDELDALIEEYPDICDDWDEKYGDRMNQIVIIGKGYKKADIIKLLDDCIDEEFDF